MATLPYLNSPVLDAIDPGQFQAQKPFPWTNAQYFIAPDLYGEVLQSLPDLGRFTPFFGKQRKHGQACHDRYILDYERGMDIAQPWR
ncbi:MAG: hypothetical protein IPG64_27190 [Haliea sp.]|nr:hypothetical protein [Haliea sp.]